MNELGSKWPDTEWSLIGRTQRGGATELSNRAWRDLVESYRVPIERVLRHYLAGAKDVDEAVQSFFSYLFEGRVLEKPRSEDGRFRAYVQAVARNYARHWLRKRKGDSLSALEGDFVEVVEPDARAWLPTILDLSLTRLREKDAEILRRFYGLNDRPKSSGDDLAAMLGTSRAAAFKRLHGARLRLRDELRETVRKLSADESAWAQELEWITEVLESRLASPPPD